jgi:quercetin 2,3-dioxygenase
MTGNSIEVRRASSRFTTAAEGRVTRHSFSFGVHYDPGNVGFGALVCHNDDSVEPGHGYDDHPHRDVEVVTWVLSGALSHRDSEGRSGVITPGTVQVMSAGSGIVHAETVEPGAGLTRFVQTWVRPDQPGDEPRYETADITDVDGWVPVTSGGDPDAATRIGTRAATLWIASASAGSTLVLPEAASAHLFVATGAVALGTELLTEADAARITGDAGNLTATDDSQLMLWSFTPAG